MNKIFTPILERQLIANLLLKYNYQVKKDNILAGCIIGIERNYLLLDLGLTNSTFLPQNELFLQSEEKSTLLLPLNKIREVSIIGFDPLQEKTTASLRSLHYLRVWERLKQMDFKNMTFYTKITKSIKGGKNIDFDGLNLFLPNSQLSKYYKRKGFKGQSLAIKILEVKDIIQNKQKNHIVITSSKLSLFKKYTTELYLGLKNRATVIRIRKYGLFLNIFGIKCLLHISEIGTKKIENIYELYKKGDQIDVRIIYINMSEGKIALSAKVN